MIVHRHAENSLIALGRKMPVPASAIIDRLRKMEAPKNSVALEVCRMTMAHGARELGGTNGDSVVVIIRDGEVITAMLRRSWNQAFDPATLRVEEVQSWHLTEAN